MSTRQRVAKVLRCMARDYDRHAERLCTCTRGDVRAYYGGQPR